MSFERNVCDYSDANSVIEATSKEIFLNDRQILDILDEIKREISKRKEGIDYRKIMFFAQSISTLASINYEKTPEGTYNKKKSDVAGIRL